MSFFKKILNTLNTISDSESDSSLSSTNNVCNNHTNALKKDELHTSYDLKLLKKFENNFYLLQGDNRKKAIADILYLNLYLKRAAEIFQAFPLKQISEKDLNFNKKVVTGRNQCCFISFAPKTTTGKPPKYPITLHFNISERLFGNLSYSQNDEIDKAEIILWENSICYEIKLRVIKGVLDLHTIYKTNTATNTKNKIYYQ